MLDNTECQGCEMCSQRAHRLLLSYRDPFLRSRLCGQFQCVSERGLVLVMISVTVCHVLFGLLCFAFQLARMKLEAVHRRQRQGTMLTAQSV